MHCVSSPPAAARRLLLAEADRDLRGLLATMLEESGACVIAVGNGRDALALLRRERFDAAVLGVRMPSMSGLDVLREATLSFCVVPIVLVSSFADAEARARATTLGAVLVLEKPLDPGELSRALDTVLSDPSLALKLLLRGRIGSAERLEILWLLRRHRDHSWTPNAVARRVDVSPVVAAEALDHLCRGNLVDVTAFGEALHFRYDPGTPALEALVSELEQLYLARPLGVMRLLGGYESERLRSALRERAALDPRRSRDG